MAFLGDNPRLDKSTSVTPLLHEHPKKQRPPDRWNSYDDWKDNDPMRIRLERFMFSISKDALKSHVEKLLHSSVTLSDRFSAGQYWWLVKTQEHTMSQWTMAQAELQCVLHLPNHRCHIGVLKGERTNNWSHSNGIHQRLYRLRPSVFKLGVLPQHR
ncbi:hypothetical protein QBC45DRAFT_72036 [Copromyces sp. CBS 386.78]|nr:hypothetical protein QBC45DRAFT_72036 [Copromyces sp. CBS 386.78]